MQRGFQRRLRALFQSRGQTLEPLSELPNSFPCVIFLLCLPLRHLHNNHDRVRTDVTLPDSHTHAHAGGKGEHTVCSTYTYLPLMSTKHAWPYSDTKSHSAHTPDVKCLLTMSSSQDDRTPGFRPPPLLHHPCTDTAGQLWPPGSEHQQTNNLQHEAKSVTYPKTYSYLSCSSRVVGVQVRVSSDNIPVSVSRTLQQSRCSLTGQTGD